MSLVLRLPRKMHLCRSCSNVPRLPSFLEMLQNPHVLLTFDKVHSPLRLPRKTTLQSLKARTCGALYILTSKCASRHNFEMCFAPQWRALFQHLNFQKWSTAEVLCTFSLGNVLSATMACTFPHLNFKECSEGEVLLAFSLANVLRATTACTFSTSQRPKVL